MPTEERRVAVVTGSNKGIGLAIVRGLCQQFKGDVILTARKEELGRQAVNKLNADGLHPIFHQLDITDKDSICELKSFLLKDYGGLDVLVNNAGILGKNSIWKADVTPDKEVEIVTTNFTGTLDVCEALFPLLRPHARVVNVSSFGSFYGLLNCTDAVRETFTEKTLSMENLKQMMDRFVSSARDGTSAGFFHDGYCMSKVGVISMTFIQQRDLDKSKHPDVLINACCPGVVRTDMTSNYGCKSTEEGAETPIYLALLPPNTTIPKGEFVSEKKIESWNSSKWSIYKTLARHMFYVCWYYVTGLFK